MARLKDDMVPFLTAQEIQVLVKKLAKQVERDFAGQDIVLICNLKGSILLAADLSRALDLPQKIDFVKLRSSRDRNTQNYVVNIQKDITMNIADKAVIIVEEIIDNARTVSFLKERLMAAGPRTVRVLTLLDKPARRVVPLKPDYIGKTIEDRFVVGYGMDEEEKGRNYSDIYFLRN